jgi:hypothetical protein
MERFFDGMDQENSKNTRRKGTDQEKKLKQEGKNGGKKKKRFLFCIFNTYVEVPILVCSPLVGNAVVQPSIRRTHSYGKTPLQHSSFIHFIHSFT